MQIHAFKRMILGDIIAMRNVYAYACVVRYECNLLIVVRQYIWVLVDEPLRWAGGRRAHHDLQAVFGQDLCMMCEPT